ncbi:hypothetical protein PanWU01x14_038020, partial [Parasponia andersonii]
KWLLAADCEHRLPLWGQWQSSRHQRTHLQRRRGKRRSTLQRNEKSPSRISRQARLLLSLKLRANLSHPRRRPLLLRDQARSIRARSFSHSFANCRRRLV